ncbi:MAG: hypothetical protein M1826_000529 [Phylliscum demangeonii]|nr:MAG: hypothetical protein M1826_000529 [Phylliscum demangeonii]
MTFILEGSHAVRAKSLPEEEIEDGLGDDEDDGFTAVAGPSDYHQRHASLAFSHHVTKKPRQGETKPVAAHASAKADKQQPMEAALDDAFESFVGTLEDEDWPTNYTDDLQRPASQAYWRFWQAWRDTGRRGA